MPAKSAKRPEGHPSKHHRPHSDEPHHPTHHSHCLSPIDAHFPVVAHACAPTCSVERRIVGKLARAALHASAQTRQRRWDSWAPAGATCCSSGAGVAWCDPCPHPPQGITCRLPCELRHAETTHKEIAKAKPVTSRNPLRAIIVFLQRTEQVLRPAQRVRRIHIPSWCKSTRTRPLNDRRAPLFQAAPARLMVRIGTEAPWLRGSRHRWRRVLPVESHQTICVDRPSAAQRGRSDPAIPRRPMAGQAVPRRQRTDQYPPSRLRMPPCRHQPNRGHDRPAGRRNRTPRRQCDCHIEGFRWTPWFSRRRQAPAASPVQAKCSSFLNVAFENSGWFD